MKRLFSVIVLIAVLTVPLATNARTSELEEDWIAPIEYTFHPIEYNIAPDPPAEKGDFGLFPFLGKSFYRFVLKPAYKATKASGLTGGKAVKFFFVQIGHFLF